MHQQRRTTALTCIGVALFAHWSAGDGNAITHASNALIVVTNTSDENFVKRIGNGVVKVEILFTPGVDLTTASYETCNNRVRGLVGFEILFFRRDTDCPVQQFWRNRMAAANPEGHVRRLPQSRHQTEIEYSIQRAKEIHAALISKLPDQRERLDANLQSELYRLCSPGTSALHLAMHK